MKEIIRRMFFTIFWTLVIWSIIGTIFYLNLKIEGKLP
jgi:hypothetical protein